MTSIRRKIPVTFQGNKTKHIERFIDYINNCEAQTYVDLFGGSCFLSYVVHILKPNAKVICNDYDDYLQRLNNIDTTNEIIDAIKAITTNKHNEKYTPEQTQQIKSIIKDYKTKGRFIDVLTISNCLVFSGNFYLTVDELLKQNIYYNKLPKKNYEAQWYLNSLQGIEFVKKDWQELFNEYKDNPDVCFISDPPYYGTNSDSYTGNSWTLRNTLDTFEILKRPYFVYYTSEKSRLIELIDYLNDKFLSENKIQYQKHIVQRGGLNKDAKSWNDIMITNI